MGKLVLSWFVGWGLTVGNILLISVESPQKLTIVGRVCCTDVQKKSGVDFQPILALLALKTSRVSPSFTNSINNNIVKVQETQKEISGV